jgi:Tfp pilus assembly protein PilF
MTFRRCFFCVALACLLLAAARPPTPKEQMKFGVAAAQQGLWREAIFRWEKLVKIEPVNARLLNNLAVAYESIGDVEGAGRSYREALRLAPASKEIRDNYNSFMELCKSFRQCAGSEAATGGTVTPPEPPAAPLDAPAAEPSPQATPTDAAP